MGDLNFRIDDLTREEVEKYIKQKDFDTLMKKDQVSDYVLLIWYWSQLISKVNTHIFELFDSSFQFILFFVHPHFQLCFS